MKNADGDAVRDILPVAFDAVGDDLGVLPVDLDAVRDAMDISQWPLPSSGTSSVSFQWT